MRLMDCAQALEVISSAQSYDAELEQQNGWTPGHSDSALGDRALDGSRVPPPGLAQAASDATNKMTIAL
jgi:hypothetical protein